VANITLDTDHEALNINLNSTSDGTLRVELPRNVIDSKSTDNTDVEYLVLIDGGESDSDELSSNNQVRTLSVDFDKGTKTIQFIGTKIIGEKPIA
jgi:hypothetical protein